MDPVIAQEIHNISKDLSLLPDVPIPHLLLPAFDKPNVTMKPLNTIFTGKPDGIERQFSNSVTKKCLKFTYAVQGYVSSSQIRDILNRPTERASGTEMAAAREFVNDLQNKDLSLEGGCWSQERIATHTRNLHAGNSLRETVQNAIARMSASFQSEINGIKNGSINIFRFKERTKGSVQPPTRQRPVESEVTRLKRLLKGLQAYPISQFPANIPIQLVQTRQLPSDLNEADRKNFYLSLIDNKILGSANSSIIDSFEFMQSVEQSSPFQHWKLQQFLFNSDRLHTDVITPRLANLRFQQVHLENTFLPVVRSEAEKRIFFQALRLYHDTYNADIELREEGPEDGFEHMLVESTATLTSKP